MRSHVEDFDDESSEDLFSPESGEVLESVDVPPECNCACAPSARHVAHNAVSPNKCFLIPTFR